MLVYESPEAVDKERPVTWCTEVRNTMVELEHQLNHAMHVNQLEAITAAVAAAEDKPVDCKLVHQCRQVKAKLESEIQLGKAMQVQVITSLEEFGGVHDALTRAIEDAENKNADVARVDAAKTLRRKLMAEASLMRSMQGPQKTTTGHIMMLEELTKAAMSNSASEELLTTATKLIAKLQSERQVQHRIAAARPLCAFANYKDVEASPQDALPQWWHETVLFEEFHEDYKNIVEVGEGASISADIQTEALEQLAQLEHFLVLKKSAEEESKLKAFKKKKGKK
jgi:hypothetical protein